MNVDNAPNAVALNLPWLTLRLIDLGPSLTASGPQMQSLRQPHGPDGVECKQPPRPAKTLSPEAMQRAVVVAGVLGNMHHFANIKRDFTGEAGQAHRARVAVHDMLRGWFQPGCDAAVRLKQVGDSIFKALTGSLAWNIKDWPEQLFETESHPRRGVDAGSTRAEYIAAGLGLVNALAERSLIDLSTIVGEKEVASLVDLVGAAKAMHNQRPASVFGTPVPFLRVTDSVSVRSWDGYQWQDAMPALTPEASHQALLSHFAGRGAVCRAAIADVAHEALAILRAVKPNVAAKLDLGDMRRSAAVDTTLPRHRVGYPFERKFTINHRDRAPETVEQILVTKGLPHVIAANGLGVSKAEDYRLNHGLDVIVFEGFVDTPRSRETAVNGAREVVGAYVDGLSKIAGYGRFTDPGDAVKAATLCDELALLVRSLRAGPLAAPIAKSLDDFKYPAKLEQVLTRMSGARDSEHGRTLAEAVERLRAAFKAA